MLSILKKTNWLLLGIIFFSCNSHAQKKESENEKLYSRFAEWENNLIQSGEYVNDCPTAEDFEKISDKSKYNRLDRAKILPKNYSTSFGYFNDDDQIDALFSFSTYTCGIKNELTVRTLPGLEPEKVLVLVQSSPEGYKIKEKPINIQAIEALIQKKLQTKKISIDINKIYRNNSLTGICKIWLDDICCPDTLYNITISLEEKKIWLHINSYEVQSLYEFDYE